MLTADQINRLAGLGLYADTILGSVSIEVRKTGIADSLTSADFHRAFESGEHPDEEIREVLSEIKDWEKAPLSDAEMVIVGILGKPAEKVVSMNSLYLYFKR